jgi:hypothetical protein
VNEEQKRILRGWLERAQRAIEELKLVKDRDVSGEIASYRDDIWMLQNDEFMEGFFESWEEVKRHEHLDPLEGW